MSRTGITFQEVKKAIAELQGRQKNPTVDHIREILGTGSKSTIARFLREWKAQQGLGPDDHSQLPSDLLGIVNGLWSALQHKADAQIEQYQLEFEAKTVQLQQQLVKATQLEASLRQTIHTLEEQLHQQKEEAQQFNATLTTESREKIRLSERTAALEARCHEHHAENQRLHQLLKHVQENLEHYQAATAQLRQEQSLLMEKQQNDYEQRLSLSQAQANTEAREKSACQAQHEQLTKAHEALMTDHQTLKQQHLETHSQVEFLRITLDKTQLECDTLKAQNQTQFTELTTQQHRMMALQLEITSRNEKMASLEKALASANDKIETLRHESQFVRQEKSGLEGQLKQMQDMLKSSKALETAGH